MIIIKNCVYILLRYNRSCKTFEDPSGRTSVPDKMENPNINVLNIILL